MVLTAGAADRGRRLALGACVAAPLVVGAALARVRAALVGARDLDDSRVDGAAFPRRLRGPTGATRVLPAPPRRIVSTYLGADELLAALVAPDRLAAVSVFADDPASSNCAGVYPRTLARVRADPEAIIALDPDLVCVAGFTQPDALRQIIGAGLPVVRWSRFDSFGDVTAHVRLIGAAVGEDARAARVTAAIDATLRAVAARVAGVRPARVLYLDPPRYTAGRGTLVGDIVERAGGINVAAELGLVGPCQIGIEAILAADPDAIVTARYGGETSVPDPFAGDPIWRRLRAVRAGRVIDVPGAWIGSVSQYAARGLDLVARRLHPAAFG